jgi:hypothetical protein
MPQHDKRQLSPVTVAEIWQATSEPLDFGHFRIMIRHFLCFVLLFRFHKRYRARQMSKAFEAFSQSGLPNL